MALFNSRLTDHEKAGETSIKKKRLPRNWDVQKKQQQSEYSKQIMLLGNNTSHPKLFIY